jgi:hypothetical protein
MASYKDRFLGLPEYRAPVVPVGTAHTCNGGGQAFPHSSSSFMGLPAWEIMCRRVIVMNLGVV